MLEIRGLSKKFGKAEVLKNFSHNFKPGAVTAIAGPNGSGKSTLIKCITGLLKFSEGEILVAGQNTGKSYSYKKHIGYMSQKPSFPENLTVAEILEFVKSVLNAEEFDTTLVELFDYKKELDKKFGVLSGGNKQKLNAILTFLHKPEVLLLDEPTAGLDRESGMILRDKIISGKNAGNTIVLTTHIPEEIAGLADFIILLEDGEKKGVLSNSQFISRFGAGLHFSDDKNKGEREDNSEYFIKSLAV